jgi:3-deoxy-7-phosphoheptulonate synthase
VTSRGSRIVAFALDDGASQRAVDAVLKELGFDGVRDKHCRWHRNGQYTVQLLRPVHDEKLERARDIDGIKRLFGIAEVGSLVARQNGNRSVVELPNGARIGGDEPTVIAGPCSIEGEEQILAIARVVAEGGATALRGGVFKPRTAPYSFCGLGERGLQYMKRAREETGLPIVTEALDQSDVELVAEHGDMIQVGSRNMSNFPLLFQVGNHPSAKPVLLKRGFGATIDEFLFAAEYILLGRLLAGQEPTGVVLCERGIRTFEDTTRFTIDVAALPVLRERTHLPILSDPSHPAGARHLVPALALASMAAGADGILVEVHTDPPSAWSDAAQTINPEQFETLMQDLKLLNSLEFKSLQD